MEPVKARCNYCTSGLILSSSIPHLQTMPQLCTISCMFTALHHSIKTKAYWMYACRDISSVPTGHYTSCEQRTLQQRITPKQWRGGGGGGP
jgi:hypothetical protein